MGLFPVMQGDMSMKKRLFSLTAALLLAGAGLFVLASYAPNGRELVSLGYLQNTVLPQLTQSMDETLAMQDAAHLQQVDAGLAAISGSYDFQAGEDSDLTHSATAEGLRFKKGDVLRLTSGSCLLPLAGEVQISFPSGSVIDVTSGLEVVSGTSLPNGHRFLTAERTVAAATILSDTAVLAVEGSYRFTPSTTPDYNAMADALKTMSLFRGTDTGYGSGYDLEKAPTRIQGLILFLRLIGEEDAALATTAPCPFTDLAAWCQPYGAYAFEKGYTKGVSETLFAPDLPLRSTEYLTFVLRSLGYTDSGDAPDFTWDTSLIRGLEFGLLTPLEHKMLTEQPFLRAQAVYVSYYALDALRKGEQTTLLTKLEEMGVVDPATAAHARTLVTTPRLSSPTS